MIVSLFILLNVYIKPSGCKTVGLIAWSASLVPESTILDMYILGS